MRSALRPYATAGIAIAGASVIAVTPITAPPPDVQVRSVELSAAVQTLDAVSPTAEQALTPAEAYQYLFQMTFAYMLDAIAPIVSNPTPIMDQILANQLANATLLAGIGENVANTLVGFAQNLPQVFETAVAQVQAGDVEAAILTVWNGAIFGPLLGAGFAFLPALQIPGQVAQNFANVVQSMPMVVASVGLGAVAMLNSTAIATAQTAQDISDAVGSGDPSAALDALLIAPATITGAFLNGGFPPGNIGLINGVLKNLILARETIAEALGAPPRTVPEAPLTALAALGTQALDPPDLGLALDPIAQWADILTTAFANIGWIGEQWLADPAPFLRQVVTNQIGYATLVADTMGTVVPSVLSALLDPSVPNGFAWSLVKAAELVQADDITGASSAIFNGLVGTAFGLFPMANLLQIPVQMSANLNSVLETVASLPISVGFGAIRVVGHFFTSAGVSGQAISDALADQDTVAALEALISAPGNITGAVLNGDRFGGGLLSNNGIIATLALSVPRMLADAITPEAEPAGSPLDESSRPTADLPSASDVTGSAPVTAVTLSIEPAGDTAETTDETDGSTDLSDGNKATPDDSAGTVKHRKPTRLSTTLKSIGDDVDKTVSKMADGVKKALGGDKSVTNKSDNKSGAESGGDDSAGSGESG